MNIDLISTLSSLLQRRQLPESGFAEYPGGDFRPDATAWSILALEAADVGDTGIDLGRKRLSRAQREDGRVSIDRQAEGAAWPTPLALLAWGAAPEYRDVQTRAVRFLLETSGLHWPRQSDSPIAHDTSIRGWPWVVGAHSWIEPTSLVILALRAIGKGGHPRVKEASRMILDRQLESGGWNYGNTRVYGQSLRPMPDATGLALRALAGVTDGATVVHSLGYLESVITEIRTPFSLGWGLLGLNAWGRRCSETERLIVATLDLESQLGSYPTSHLSLLLLAPSTAGTGGRFWLMKG